MGLRPMIVCKKCKDEKPHAAGGMCYPCYKEHKNRRMDGAYKNSKIDRAANGRPLCRWCKKEVPRGRRTFCGEECIHQWSLRTSPQYVRRKVFERDGGVCAMCNLDTVALENELMELARNDHKAYAAKWNTMIAVGFKSNRKHGLWDADHIVAVVEGGGMHGLENYRTLCIPCHKKETALLRKRMAVAARVGKRLGRKIEIEDLVDLPCTCNCKDGATCLDCPCHWRPDPNERISVSRPKVEEVEAALKDDPGLKARTEEAKMPEPRSEDARPLDEAEMAKKARDLIADLFR